MSWRPLPQTSNLKHQTFRMSREDLPHIQFYIGDWRRDMGIQSLSYHYRGIWFELLMMMYCSDQRGKLVLGTRPMSDESIARMLGLSHEEWAKARHVLLATGVPSVDEHGALYCRRMVKDEDIRRSRSAAGQKGGQQTSELFFATAKVQAKPKQNSGNGNGSDLLGKQGSRNQNGIEFRLGKIFGRRETTVWSEKERKALGGLSVVPDDLALVERYYSEKMPKDADFRRRDLLTLLNNWPGEVDRARARPKPKVKNGTQPARLPLQETHAPMNEDEFKRRHTEWVAKGRPLGEFPA